MPVTPIYGLPYSALTDPPNGPAQQQALAEAVESQLSTTNGDVSNLDTRVGTAEADIVTLQKQAVNGKKLTDDTAAAATAWEQWGTETVTFLNPGAPVSISAWVTGRLENTLNTDSNGGARVAISIDGGATFTTPGNVPIVNMGTSVGTRNGIACMAYTSGTPTGSVIVKAELIVSTTNIQAKDGYLLVHLTPQ